MIADPYIVTVHNVSGTLLTGEQINIEKLYDGPGAATTRKGLASTIPGLVYNVAIKHEVTKAGRRRSTWRCDAVAPVGTTGLGEPAALQSHSASAYIVLDRLESEVASEKAMVDAAVACLINSIVYSREAASAFVATVGLIDFMKGEP
jgi:hypothetical protein